MTTTSVGAEPLSSSYLSNYATSSSLHSFARRHSIYGTEDRVVFDIGSLYIKCGFSGEPQPRHIVKTWSRLRPSREVDGEGFLVDDEPSELYDLDLMATGHLQQLEERLKKLLHDIYFRLLLTDPKSRKVILCESPLAPIALKQALANVLFHYFQVPTISFVPLHLMALLTTGLTTGLVLDCGNLETTALPVYTSRPLFPYISTSALAGRSLTQRLRTLMLEHARYIPPSHLHLSLAPQTAVPPDILRPQLLEDIKTRLLFCSPLLMPTEENADRIADYKNFSSATDTYYPVVLQDGTKATLLIPGWVRERTAEVLFEGDEDDEPSLAHCIMNTLLKMGPDLRKPLISTILLVGGTSALPGFQSRLKQEIIRIMRDPTKHEQKRYGSLLRLQKAIRFIDNPEESKGAGRIFMSNVRGWIGGSLMGSLKMSSEELTREKYAGHVTDWSIGHWGMPPPVTPAATLNLTSTSTEASSSTSSA